MTALFTVLGLWLKAIHIISMTIFIGGVLTASLSLRLECKSKSKSWVKSEYRWDQIMTTPALFITFLSGLILAVSGQWFSSKWLPVKIVFVLILAAIHGIQAKALRQLTNDISKINKQLTSTIFVCAIFIIILAVIKPYSSN